MSKPPLGERVAIEEQLKDMNPTDPKMYGAKFATEEDIIRVAELGNNAGVKPEDVKRKYGAGVLNFSSWSFGIRETDAELIDAEPLRDEDYSENLGAQEYYDLSTATKVTIGSGTSGARIEFSRPRYSDEPFTARFLRGEKGPSTMYASIFHALGSQALHDGRMKSRYDNPLFDRRMLDDIIAEYEDR